MTISTETATITATGDGSNTTFTYNFLIPYQADGVTPAVAAFITVAGVDTALTLTTDYTITGVGDGAGGEVEYPDGVDLDAPSTITILRDEAYVQPFAFPMQGLRPDQVEAALDWVVMQTQQLARDVALLTARVAELEA